MPFRSYVRSTDFHRKPCGKNVLCRVDISVMVHPTVWAVPLTNIQRQLFNDVPTVATSLRTRKPAVNLDQRATIPIALVFELFDQLSPTCVTDREGKFSVLHHVLHSQILDGDGLVFTHQSSRQLVKRIFSRISDFLMHLCDFEPRFVSIVRPFLFAAQRLLSFFQLAVFRSKAFRVCNLFTRTQSNQARYTQINTISLEHRGNGSISTSTNKETVHLPAGESFTVIVEGIAPFGSSRLQRIASGSAHLARKTCPSFHLNADLVNSALPPLHFFLKVGYFVHQRSWRTPSEDVSIPAAREHSSLH
ncbi:hypothetical protein NIES2104_34820 [Leptolyngbya sp. NIES-2104]|nr:hypothetical protein NIES2104_34820 [Leptolyngbya sp. NIES-2104]